MLPVESRTVRLSFCAPSKGYGLPASGVLEVATVGYLSDRGVLHVRWDCTPFRVLRNRVDDVAIREFPLYDRRATALRVRLCKRRPVGHMTMWREPPLCHISEICVRRVRGCPATLLYTHSYSSISLALQCDFHRYPVHAVHTYQLFDNNRPANGRGRGRGHAVKMGSVSSRAATRRYRVRGLARGWRRDRERRR